MALIVAIVTLLGTGLTIWDKRRADHHDIWWNRTQWALERVIEGVAKSDRTQLTIGLTMLYELGHSELATSEELDMLGQVADPHLPPEYQRRSSVGAALPAAKANRPARARLGAVRRQYASPAPRSLRKGGSSMSADDGIENSHIAAARLKKLIMERKNENVPDWLASLAARNFAPESIPTAASGSQTAQHPIGTTSTNPATGPSADTPPTPGSAPSSPAERPRPGDPAPGNPAPGRTQRVATPTKGQPAGPPDSGSYGPDPEKEPEEPPGPPEPAGPVGPQRQDPGQRPAQPSRAPRHDRPKQGGYPGPV